MYGGRSNDNYCNFTPSYAVTEKNMSKSSKFFGKKPTYEIFGHLNQHECHHNFKTKI